MSLLKQAFMAALVLGARPVAAQIDYRNLDDDRPVSTEDAYPVEHRAVELSLPYGFERHAGRSLHFLVPEIAWGALPNFEFGLKLPLAAGSLPGSNAGVAGLRGFGIYNFFTESPALPALAMRGDLHLPVGEFGGRGARAGLGLLLTRSWGPWRLHANGGWGFGDPSRPALVEALPRWRAGGAVDRTLWRSSLLLIGDVTARASARGAPTEVVAGAGFRWQWTPTLVLDAGVRRRLGAEGPDLGLSLGVSHSFGLRPGRAAARELPPGPLGTGYPERRSESFYYPGGFNWSFLGGHPEAARLFNAFDYGHAVLYERLYTDTEASPSELEEREYGNITRDLLLHPPRLGVAEEAVAPAYSRLAWKAKAMFDWAHLLHRQIYDIYADERLSDSTRAALVERVTDAYLADRDLAFTSVPKSMALMDEQYYSQVFRARYPRFNGLIWSYHWLQVGLYEPLIRGRSAAEKRAGVKRALDHFRGMLQAPPASMPQVMPMTAAVAPEFTRRHPRAAAIFDNLHMMHDIISDILASDRVPRARKRQEIYAALSNFRDGSRDTMSTEHWLMMGDMMGGVERMGGTADFVEEED